MLSIVIDCIVINCLLMTTNSDTDANANDNVDVNSNNMLVIL